AVRGLVVANVGGERTQLEILDGILERTRLELTANSELRICHYSTRTQITLKGPLRAEVWADDATAENARAVERSSAPCTAPDLTGAQNGHQSRGVSPRAGSVAVPAPPNSDLDDRITLQQSKPAGRDLVNSQGSCESSIRLRGSVEPPSLPQCSP